MGSSNLYYGPCIDGVTYLFVPLFPEVLELPGTYRNTGDRTTIFRGWERWTG